MEEDEAEAVQDVEEEPGDAAGQEQEEGEDAEAAPEEEGEAPEQATVPVKARIICPGGEEPMTIGKSLVPGGSPLHMEVPGAGTLVLTASLKAPPEPPPSDVKCICPVGGKRRGSADEQIKALTTTMDQISSMQQLLSDMKNKAQALSQQLQTGGRGPPPTQPMPPMGMPGPGGMQMPQRPMPMPMPMPGADFGRVPPGGREVFSGPGVGIYVVQKDASPMGGMGGMGAMGGMGGMGGGMPYDYTAPAADPRAMAMPASSCPACESILPLPAPDMGQRDWASPAPMAPPPPVPATQSRGADAYGGGGGVCCGGGGQMVCCGGGGMSCCGGARVLCCGGGVRIGCCGGGIPVGCCGPRVNTCCGGGGGGGPQQQPGGYSAAPGAEQELALCQGDCTNPCDSAATCVGRR